jgi:hypothetical protein
MSLTIDDTDFVYDFDQYDREQLIAEISQIRQEEQVRIYRKHTNPAKVLAPIKRKPVEDLEEILP